MIQLNMEEIIISESEYAKSIMLGHSLTSTTLNIYAHSIENVNKTAFNAVANLLLN